MHLKSMYPELPAIPHENFHNLMFRRPGQKEWNHTVFVDAFTGEKRTFRQFHERVLDGATALGGPHGLGLTGENEIIGILGENCMVRVCSCPCPWT